MSASLLSMLQESLDRAAHSLGVSAAPAADRVGAGAYHVGQAVRLAIQLADERRSATSVIAEQVDPGAGGINLPDGVYSLEEVRAATAGAPRAPSTSLAVFVEVRERRIVRWEIVQ